MTDKIKNIMIIVLIALVLSAGGFGLFFFLKAQHITQRETQARVNAQNTIASLSETIKESEKTWSRLAQEREVEIEELRERIPELMNIISERDEEITTLTETIAHFEPVRVIVRRENVTQTPEPPIEPGQPERTRVAFDQIWNDFMRVHGFTLTNPGEADIQIDYMRPVRVSVVTTQREDLSWRSYISHDIPNLEIESIESIVNPISRPQEESHWYDGIYVGVGAALAGGDSIAGYGQLEVGFDFGNIELGLMATGIGHQNGGAFGGGLALRVNPFAL